MDYAGELQKAFDYLLHILTFLVSIECMLILLLSWIAIFLTNCNVIRL